MVTTIITTRNGQHKREHSTYEDAWGYIQAFVAVTKDADWEMVMA